MRISKVDTVIKFKDKHLLIKGLVYLKLAEMDVVIPDNDVNILSLFVSNENKEEVIKEALSKDYIKSWQSGENAVSRLVNLSLLEKAGRKKRKVCFLPKLNDEHIAATCKLHNINM